MTASAWMYRMWERGWDFCPPELEDILNGYPPTPSPLCGGSDWYKRIRECVPREEDDCVFVPRWAALAWEFGGWKFLVSVMRDEEAQGAVDTVHLETRQWAPQLRADAFLALRLALPTPEEIEW